MRKWLAYLILVIGLPLLSQSTDDVYDGIFQNSAEFSSGIRTAFAEYVFEYTGDTIYLSGQSTLGGSTWNQLTIFVDDTLYTTVNYSGTESQQTITFPEGQKTIRIVDGLTSDPSGTILGTRMTGLLANSAEYTKVSHSPGTEKLVFIGNSITVGGNTPIPARDAWSRLFYSDAGKDVGVYGYGWAELTEIAGTSTLVDSTTDRLFRMFDSCTNKKIVIMLGTNDYGLSSTDSATFIDAYEELLDSIDAKMPDANVYCIGPLQRFGSDGALLESYRNGIEYLCGTHNYAFYDNGYGYIPQYSGYMDDSVHPDSTGHHTVYDSVYAWMYPDPVATTVSGQTYSNTSPTWSGVTVSRTVPTDYTFTMNSITSHNTSNYMLDAGDEGNWHRNNNLDGATITGNKFIWNGSDATGVHDIQTGYNINYNIQHNYFSGGGYGIVIKSGELANNMTYTDGGVANNIFKNFYYDGVLVKGMNGVEIYNNTFVDTTSHANNLINVGSNYDQSQPQSPTNVKIKNNLFYMEDSLASKYFIRVEAASLATLECDYNVYYCENTTNNEPYFWAGQIYTWSQWQALGFDTHSVIMDPQFQDTLYSPGVPVAYGTNLGEDFDTQLSSGYNLTPGSYPDTTAQSGTWMVGAVVGGYPADYYVATWGDDSDDGSFETPWATWQKAFSTANAGDTVYFRGGTYSEAEGTYGYSLRHMPEVTPRFDTSSFTQGVAVGAGIGNNGTPTNPICFYNYPGEEPILDYDGFAPDTAGGDWFNTGVTMQYSAFLRFRGLTIRNIYQLDTSITARAWELNACNNISFENCVVHNVGGRAWGYAGGYISEIWRAGVEIDSCEWINCDAYNLCDTLCEYQDVQQCGDASRGGVADGFKWDNSTASRLLIRGCRAWNYSDNGIDCSGNGLVEIDSCWVFLAGYQDFPDMAGEGSGIKYPSDAINDPEGAVTRIIHHNIAAYMNGMGGIDESMNSGYYNIRGEVFNNTAWVCGTYGFYNHDSSTVDPPAAIHYRNNLAYDCGTAQVSNTMADVVIDEYNSWDGPPYTYPSAERITVTAEDFVTTDSATIVGLLTASRQSNGSLPSTWPIRLADGSDLIDAGTTISGFLTSYLGEAPDVGSHERSSVIRYKASRHSGGFLIGSDGRPMKFLDQ